MRMESQVHHDYALTSSLARCAHVCKMPLRSMRTCVKGSGGPLQRRKAAGKRSKKKEVEEM